MTNLRSGNELLLTIHYPKTGEELEQSLEAYAYFSKGFYPVYWDHQFAARATATEHLAPTFTQAHALEAFDREVQLRLVAKHYRLPIKRILALYREWIKAGCPECTFQEEGYE